MAAMDDMDRRLVRTSGDGYQYVGSLKGCGSIYASILHHSSSLRLEGSWHPAGTLHLHCAVLPLSWPA